MNQKKFYLLTCTKGHFVILEPWLYLFKNACISFMMSLDIVELLH